MMLKDEDPQVWGPSSFNKDFFDSLIEAIPKDPAIPT
jgi:hypothetical protein